MKLAEFVEQNRYCEKENIPNGKGCDFCPAQDKDHCADSLLNLCSKLRNSLGKPEFGEISKQLERDYGLTPYNQTSIFKWELEFPQ